MVGRDDHFDILSDEALYHDAIQARSLLKIGAKLDLVDAYDDRFFSKKPCKMHHPASKGRDVVFHTLRIFYDRVKFFKRADA